MTALSCAQCPVKGQSVVCQVEGVLLDKLDTTKLVQSFPNGAALFYEGNAPHGLYAIVEGKVKLVQRANLDSPHIMRVVGPGDLVGYRALLSGEDYSSTAEALEPTRACLIDRATFQDLLKNSPEVAERFFNKLCKELGAAERKVVALSQKSVRSRLASLLLELKDRFSPDGTLLGVELTREDLAELAGTTQESASRVLSEFQRKGVITAQQRRILVRDEPKLKALAIEAG